MPNVDLVWIVDDDSSIRWVLDKADDPLGLLQGNGFFKGYLLQRVPQNLLVIKSQFR